MTVVTLDHFNQQAAAEAADLLLQVCHCQYWCEQMLVARPFASLQALRQAAADIWAGCDEAQRLEAFRGHARIGDLDAIRKKFATASEQGQVLQSSEAVIQSLADYNQQYETKFGFIFIVCASGLSAETMLAKLQQRLPNERQTELANASGEQLKIMLLRLDKFFVEVPSINTLSTHVLDTGLGKPAAGVAICLHRFGSALPLASAITNADGRVSEWSAPLILGPGDYTLRFATAEYFSRHQSPCFYPEVTIHFSLGDSPAHYHVPLVISPWSYSTYRGS